MPKPGTGSPKIRNLDSEIDEKSDLETSPEKTWKCQALVPKRRLKMESPNNSKIDENPVPARPRIHPAAPMALQGGPEVGNWYSLPIIKYPLVRFINAPENNGIRFMKAWVRFIKGTD